MAFGGLLSGFNPFGEDELAFDYPEGDPRLLGAAPPQPQPQPRPQAAPVAEAPAAAPAKAPVSEGIGGLINKLGRYVTSPEGMLAIGTTIRAKNNPNAFADQRAIMAGLRASRAEQEKRAEQKIRNEAFKAGIEEDPKTGKTKYNAQKSAAYYLEHGGRGDVSALAKSIKDLHEQTQLFQNAQGIYRAGEEGPVETLQKFAYQEDPTKRTLIPLAEGEAAPAPQAAEGVPPPPAPPNDAGPDVQVAGAPAYLQSVGAREGTGRNPHSSAAGFGQFLGRVDQAGRGTGTWFDVMRGDPQFAADIAGKTDAEILALRGNEGIGNRAIQSYAAMNAPILQQAGVEPTSANLGMAHGYGPGAAVKIAKAPPNTPIEAIIGRHTAQINRVAGKTTGQVQGEFAQRFGAGMPQATLAAPAAATEVAARAPVVRDGYRVQEPEQQWEDLSQEQARSRGWSEGQRNRITGETRGTTLPASQTKPQLPGKMNAAQTKQVNESLYSLGVASGINTRVDATLKQLSTGLLTPSLVNSAGSWIGARTGIATPQQRAFNSFKADLEKLRNDSLRLNKGVQTEGDSERAWKEILEHLNDPEYVRERLNKVAGYNEQAIELQKALVNLNREDAGMSQVDFSKFEARPLSVERGGTNAPPGWKGPASAAGKGEPAGWGIRKLP